MSDILERIKARHAAKPDIPISVPEWELEAFIRPLSAGKVMSLRKLNDQAHVAAQTIIHGLVDKAGNPIFKDDADTQAALVGERWLLIDRIAAAIMLEGNTRDLAKN